MLKILRFTTAAAIACVLAACNQKATIELPEGMTVSDGPIEDTGVLTSSGRINIGDKLSDVLLNPDVETWIADEVVRERRYVTIVLKADGYWIGSNAVITLDPYNDNDRWVENVLPSGVKKMMNARTGAEITRVKNRILPSDVGPEAAVDWIAPVDDEPVVETAPGMESEPIPETTVIPSAEN